jgi:hypothetical protein
LENLFLTNLSYEEYVMLITLSPELMFCVVKLFFIAWLCSLLKSLLNSCPIDTIINIFFVELSRASKELIHNNIDLSYLTIVSTLTHFLSIAPFPFSAGKYYPSYTTLSGSALD